MLLGRASYYTINEIWKRSMKCSKIGRKKLFVITVGLSSSSTPHRLHSVECTNWRPQPGEQDDSGYEAILHYNTTLFVIRE